MSEACYHCGLPIPAQVALTTLIDGKLERMCCHGCQAVAQAIVDGGLADYYRNREALPDSASAHEALPEALAALKFYDHADFQKDFVRVLGENEREASLIIEGVTCAACIWLNERHLAKQPGVVAVHINYATRRAQVRWDSRVTALSGILASIAAIGYRGHPYDVATNEALASRERKRALWRLFVAGFGMMQVMMYAVPAYLARDGEMTADIEALLRWASLVLTLPVVLYSAAPFFAGAWRDLRLHRVGMDVPVALGVGAAFAASVWATLTVSGEVYFDSVAMFVFFLLGGRYLEMRARQSAVGVTEALAKLQPALALRVDGFPGERASHEVLAGELAAGDVILVRPGAIVAADGIVVEGKSSTNEALLTGESAPVEKSPGSPVTGGAINVGSPLYVRVQAVGEATRLAAIVRLMERAAREKPRLVQIADRIAARFLVVLLVIAAGVALYWSFADPSLALPITVSVLVVTCPCALSLATPIALTVASGELARRGVLVTHGHAVETLARATHVVFDKTGTLTLGELLVAEVLPLAGLDAEACLALAAALEASSEHPLGAALREAARRASAAESESAITVSQVSNVPGCGVGGMWQARELRIGRADFVAELHGRPLPPAAAALLEGGDTVVALGDANGWIALFRLADTLRPGAAAAIATLRASGREVILLSGDAPAVAARVATNLGIERCEAGMSPQGKHDFVKALQNEGARVAMVGDGVNDAPVLAAADVSVAIGSGSQLARTQADLVLLNKNLEPFAESVVLAERALGVIRQNLVWAFAYNLIALPLAMVGWVSPWLAGIGMSGSSLLVVINSLRLQAGRKK